MARASERLLALSRELAWRQWTALGVVGVRPPECRAVIDLEALILFTAGLGDADPRLRDEATDWCVQFGPRFVSASRLRNLLAAEPEQGRPPILEFLATVNSSSAARWPLPAAAKARVAVLSGKSRLAEPRKRPELLRIQLRALFGITARAEIILGFLASRPSPEPFLSAADLVATAYSKRNVALVLADLALAGLVTERKVGNQLRYRLERRAELTQLAPGAQSAFVTRWDVRLRVLAAARRLATDVEAKSDTLRNIEARRFADGHATSWGQLDVQPPGVESSSGYFDALIDLLETSTTALL